VKHHRAYYPSNSGVNNQYAGCVTCKAKRLKCDETKPTCQQCARRNVECGGYKKDYKWRPFGEASFVTSKPLASSKPKKDVVVDFSQDAGSDHSGSPREEDVTFEKLAERAQAKTLHQHTDVKKPRNLAVSTVPAVPKPPMEGSPENGDLDMPSEIFEFDTLPEIHGLSDLQDAGIEAFSMDPNAMLQQPMTSLPSISSSHAPLSMSLSNMSDGMMALDELMSIDPAMIYGTHNTTPTMSPTTLHDQKFFSNEDDEIEEVVRTGFHEMESMPWPMAPILPEFYSSPMSCMSPGSMFSMPDMFSIPRGIDMGENSPETLTLRFDRQTCGILSVKDGPTENPWRTLIWPLARDSPALYHAIASMTSFHTSKFHPELRVQGIDHMRTSIEALATGIENMQFDTAIATTLALAFAESWDQHTSTGINHIRGAKVLVKQALTWHDRKAFSGDKLERLKFLTNAWVYMDVLARLTSNDDDESNDFDAALTNPFVSSPFGNEAHIDPLMGAASTLFPIIGRVANLVRRVRRTESNSPTTISQAMELKKMLQEWDPPMVDESIEDPSVDIEHSIQTAEAYRWATLLCLHQAVPEIPSESSAELGKRVMILLATVPLSSRTVIVHIYPLIAASCEAVDQEDRQWVHERWLSMAQRMKIGVIDRCVEVVNEVWARRDAYELLPQRRLLGPKRGNPMDTDTSSGSDPIFPWSDPFANRKRSATNGAFDMLRDASINHPRKASRTASGSIDHEFTVRGRLHWLSVMKDWRWEGKSTLHPHRSTKY
jgi:hypothetical protein